MQKSVADRKGQLLARKSDLLARMATVETELDSHHDADWEDLATERESDEVLEGIGLSAQSEMRMIEAALIRIETDEYGFCAKCGARIDEERLDILPYTPFCAACAP